MTEFVKDVPEDQEAFMSGIADLFMEYSTLLSPETMCTLIKTVITDHLNHHIDEACTYLALSRLFDVDVNEEGEDEEEEDEDVINEEGFMAEVGVYHGEADEENEEDAPSIKESVTNDIF